MNSITWNGNYTVSNSLIDSQHETLFTLMDSLRKAENDDKDKTELIELLAELIDQTKLHFNTEETLMAEVRYSGYKGHKSEHDTLLEKVNNLQNFFKEGKINLTTDVITFLNDWLIKHIEHTDKKYIGII